MKLIFLDVDGVLNTRPGSLDSDKIQLLREIVEKTGAEVVLSTSWREVPRMKERLLKVLRFYGITPIGSTPEIEYELQAWGWATKAPRRDEIQSFLRGWVPCTYVILDDDVNADDGSEGWIWIDPKTGLTPTHWARRSPWR